LKIPEEIMEILEAFDLVESLRDAGELAGCSHNTVSRYVELRDAGKLSAAPERRVQVIDPYLDKVEEWMETSQGKLRADKAHNKLIALGYKGSPRTTRRAVAAARRNWSKGHRRLYRPWIPEPAMWFQWDFGDGPTIEGRKTWLFCAWLSWSKFRVVLPIWDKTLPTVIACIDTTLRRFGGVPTYSLTDNEKTVTTDIVARIPIRHPEIVAAGAHYGLTIHTCVVADPESKGGSEATVRIAKADLVPTEAKLLEEYPNFAALEGACEEWCDETNNREHRSTRRSPVAMLAEERQRLHRLPDLPYTAAFGVVRRVGDTTPVVAFDGGSYSVPHEFRTEPVWVREHGDRVVFVHVGADGPAEVARHERATPGNPSYNDEHFGPTPEGPLNRTARARTEADGAFLALGDGARLWLSEAGATGVTRVRAKMADAVALAAIMGASVVDRALGEAAVLGRFAVGDVASIAAYQAGTVDAPRTSASEDHSLQPGTSAWEGFGQ
jgi:hypothetical protein